MTSRPSHHLFLIGTDYHLGDLLWFTAVLREFRRECNPVSVSVGLPDRPVSRILERNPLIDQLHYGHGEAILAMVRANLGDRVAVHDLRMLPIALTMLRQWRRRLPWLYYRDLWMQERGQWLATFLGLGHMREYRPVLSLSEEDRAVARDLTDPYILLAPHIGAYSFPLFASFWRGMKGWSEEEWISLVECIRERGFRPMTLAATGQEPIAGSTGLIGLPIRQAAGVVEQARALVTVESGLWFVAAAFGTPFVISRWWLPRSVDWAAPMGVPYGLVYSDEKPVPAVLAHLERMRIRESA